MAKRNRDSEADGAENTPAPQRRRTEEEESPGDDANSSQARDFQVANEAEVGIIEKVTLTNFMCHTYLEIGFGSNVNFVIGRNGSGKSAIMTAVLVGLGAKAAVTSRGNSIKHFIKDGCNYALVAIRLKNTGIDSYKPETYGASIIVERRINRDGANSYKLKSADGRVCSTKKDELILILDRFNIQIDNPISVLNQDTSRSFLNSSDAKVKYQFFLRATQLEEMSQDYQGIINQKSVIESTLKRKAEVLPEMVQQVKVYEEKYQDQKQLRGLKEKVQLLKNELIWALVKEKKQELDADVAKVGKEEARLPRHDDKIEECKVLLGSLDAEWSQLNTQLNVIVDDVTAANTQKNAVQRHLKEQKTKAKIKQSAYRKLKGHLDGSVEEKCLLKDRIEEIKASSMVADLQAERIQREQNLALASEEFERYKAQLLNSHHHRNQIEAAISSAKEKSYQMKMERNGAKGRLDELSRKLQSLHDGQKNRLKLFGPWTPDLLRRVDALVKQNKFHRPPVGPIGAHIKLKDPRWALGAEACLKGNVRAYCCHDSHDEKLLREIMSAVCGRGRHPPIIVSRFKDDVYDTSEFKVRSNYPTLLDILDIPSPTVANSLIDQNQIESVLMIEEPATARTVMWKERPANASKAYALNGDEIIGGRSSKYYSNNFDRPQFLQDNLAETIRQVEADLQHHRQRVDEVAAESQSIDAELRMHQNELQKTKQKCHKEQDVINRLQNEIQEIQCYEEEQPPDVTTLEEDVLLLNTRIEELTEQVTMATSELSDATGLLHEYATEERRCCQITLDLAEKMEPVKTEMNEKEGELAKIKAHRKYYEDKKAIVVKNIEEMQLKNDGLAKEYEESIVQSREYCDEVATERTSKNLESEIVQSERRISREESVRGNPEEITAQYYNSLTRYEEVKKQVDNLKKFERRLKKVLERRATRFCDFRGLISIRAKQYFLMMLSQRGYTGRIKIDHKKKELSVQVNVEQVNGTTSKDTRALSGGERSFSTICFITALWEAMESPFRILDEFDVFMDMVNRRISMKSLLKIARYHSNRQFVFLTPQDMSNIDAGGNVRIFRLQDPERGQGVIQFPRAGPS